MSKKKSSYENYEDDWSDYKKRDNKKDHKHREERKQKRDYFEEAYKVSSDYNH